MTRRSMKSAALITVLSLSLGGCASPAFDNENENAMRNKGAAGGALLGATAGLLTGEPDLIVKGAIAGGVAGGVGGTMKDTEDARHAERNHVLAEGAKQDNRTEAEKRAADLEAELRIMELEKQIAEMKLVQE